MLKLIEQYKKDIKSSIKSTDTEEWLDTVFTRPIGYLWARLFNHFDIHPNVVTVLSMILGAAAGVFFVFDADTTRGILLNLCGVLLLMWANFYDSADGQLARMTGKKTRLGRILDGAAGDIWFFCIYVAIAIRLYPHPIPFTDIQWKLWALLLVCVAGVMFHARQSALADYYRNIHLYFLRGKEGSELDNYPQQHAIYKGARWRDDPVWKFFMWTYYRYTRGQERQTPQFQQLMQTLRAKYPGGMPPQEFRDEFRRHSLPLMKWTNTLTFNTRAIVLYITCLADIPWAYPLFEITVMAAIHWYMRHEHEKMSQALQAWKVVAPPLAEQGGGLSSLIFDYGGTLDTGSVHWSWVLWDAYVAEGVDVTLRQFREAYVHGERTLAREPLIKPEHNMLDLLRIKVDVETKYLMEHDWLHVQEVTRRAQTEHVALRCYNHVRQELERSRRVLDTLQPHYPMVLVSNFYGNIHTILRDFKLDHYFAAVVESAVAGIRKPDPRIFQLGVDALHTPATSVAVVGDSYSQDIVPASSIGCKTVWIRGRGWDEKQYDESLPTIVIDHLNQLPEALHSISNVFVKPDEQSKLAYTLPWRENV